MIRSWQKWISRRWGRRYHHVVVIHDDHETRLYIDGQRKRRWPRWARGLKP